MQELKIIDFVKDKTNAAIFNRFRCGVLYYRVRHLTNGLNYEFGIPIADLGNATVNKFEAAITLMRYIRKALEDKSLTQAYD